MTFALRMRVVRTETQKQTKSGGDDETLRCPFCGNHGSRVLDSRPVHEGRAIRRRRECEKCEQRFTTFEMIEEQPLIVIKKDGSREEFSREKLLRGLIRACEKGRFRWPSWKTLSWILKESCVKAERQKFRPKKSVKW